MCGTEILPMCITQCAQKLPFGCFDVLIEESREMTLEEFKNLATSKIVDINEAEDVFWRNVMEKKPYAINNPTSLFGDDTLVWNLDKFTRDESNIHTYKTVTSSPQGGCIIIIIIVPHRDLSMIYCF